MALYHEEKLKEVHPLLIKLIKAVAEKEDLLVVYGFRNKKEQDDAVARGASKLKFPNSAHNKTPALAVDVAPYPNQKLDWNDTTAFYQMRARIARTAGKMGIPLKELIVFKNGAKDLPHIELDVARIPPEKK